MTIAAYLVPMAGDMPDITIAPVMTPPRTSTLGGTGGTGAGDGYAGQRIRGWPIRGWWRAMLVPKLFFAFSLRDVAKAVAMPLAEGTSLAVNVPPRSVRHAGILPRGWWIWRWCGRGQCRSGWRGGGGAPYGTLGVSGGLCPCRLGHAAKLLLGKAGWRLADDRPKGWHLQLNGRVAGLLSALMSIGCGATTNPLMTLHGRAIHHAVAIGLGKAGAFPTNWCLAGKLRDRVYRGVDGRAMIVQLLHGAPKESVVLEFPPRVQGGAGDGGITVHDTAVSIQILRR
ncbi:MAG: hypothetical protein H7245_22075 [Candidatus Saccharibacteria bacterium]|nr:hypothetical protein [Pseudorhodobacter sp.]